MHQQNASVVVVSLLCSHFSNFLQMLAASVLLFHQAKSALSLWRGGLRSLLVDTVSAFSFPAFALLNLGLQLV